MRYAPINNKLFIDNREKLAKALRSGSIAVFNANDIMPTNADGTFPFVQNSDLFYLTGIDQPETILLLCPGASEKEKMEVLFIKESNDLIAVWEGERLSKDSATEISGIQTVFWTSEFEKVFKGLVLTCNTIYLNTNEHTRADITVGTRDLRFLKWCKKAYPLHEYKRLALIMHHLRAVKSQTEIALIKKACRITEKTFQKLLKFIKPGVWEFEIEAKIFQEFIKNRSRGPAFAPVVAAGKNTCVLHYTRNDNQCLDGDLLLIDFGAEYAHYASDVTRTIPVNGRFTNRQKDVYNAVLRIQRAAINMLVPGNTFKKYNQAVGEMVEKELIALGLLNATALENQSKEDPLYKKYFMHGTSHYLGLDVHDYGSRDRKFQSGMVFTCEPGLYIPEESIGVRLENDILITDDGPVDLTKEIPVESDEIETLMINKE